MSQGARTGFLHRMAAASRARVRVARAAEPEARLLARATAAPPPPPLELEDFDLIAELKLRSPAAGSLGTSGFDRRRQIEAYAAAGAAAISVLTEPDEFRGSLDHLREAAEASAAHGRPVMRKDFLTDPYQVLEARAAGAGGVLVILTMLDRGEIRELVATAREQALFVLLEAFDEGDLARVADLGLPREGPAVLVGLNCRNLKTLDVDFRRFAALAPALPAGYPAVAESGIGSAADARTVAELGYRLALVGSSLMQAAEPGLMAAELIAAGRAASGMASCS